MTLLVLPTLLALLLAVVVHLRLLIRADGYGHRPPPLSHEADHEADRWWPRAY